MMDKPDQVATYSSSVFVNCPFDTAFKPLFDALIFTIFACGFTPRCALEYDDSDDIRIQKINAIIEQCQYGVHDISLVEPRFNMPLELGIFIGCQRFGDKEQRRKKYLVLESEPYQSKRYISDLSGQDVKAHQNQPAQVIRCVRDWLANKTQRNIPHGSPLLSKYEQFRSQLLEICESVEWVVNELTFPEYSGLVVAWLGVVSADD